LIIQTLLAEEWDSGNHYCGFSSARSSFSLSLPFSLEVKVDLPLDSRSLAVLQEEISRGNRAKTSSNTIAQTKKSNSEVGCRGGGTLYITRGQTFVHCIFVVWWPSESEYSSHSRTLLQKKEKNNFSSYSSGKYSLPHYRGDFLIAPRCIEIVGEQKRGKSEFMRKKLVFLIIFCFK